MQGLGSLSNSQSWLHPAIIFSLLGNHCKFTEMESVSTKEQCPQDAYCLHILSLSNPFRGNSEQLQQPGFTGVHWLFTADLVI